MMRTRMMINPATAKNGSRDKGRNRRKGQFFIIGVVGLVLILLSLNDVINEQQQIDFSKIQGRSGFWAVSEAENGIKSTLSGDDENNTRMEEYAGSYRSAKGVGGISAEVSTKRSAEGDLESIDIKVRGEGFKIEKPAAPFLWWNRSYGFRIPVFLKSGRESLDTIIELKDIDLAQDLTDAGIAFDSVDKDTVIVADPDTGMSVPAAMTFTEPGGKALLATMSWLWPGHHAEGSAKKFYVYFDTLPHGEKDYVAQKDMPYVLDGDSKIFYTEGVMLKWGAEAGKKGWSGLGDAITEMRFDDDLDGEPSDADVLQDYGEGADAYLGGLGAGYDAVGKTYTGCGPGDPAAQATPAYVDFTLGTCRIRSYRGAHNWVQANTKARYARLFSDKMLYAECGENGKAEKVAWDEGIGGWADYCPGTESGWAAFKDPSSGLVFGMASNSTQGQAYSRESPWDKVLSMDGADKDETKLLYYSDKTNSTLTLELLAESLLNPPEVRTGSMEKKEDYVKAA